MLNLRGRLGNQIFQLSYFFDRCGSRIPIINESSSSLDNVFNELYLKTVNNIYLDFTYKLLRRIKSIILRRYSNFYFLGIYDGYFQNQNDLNPKIKLYLKGKIVDTEDAEIVIHVRGEDYLTKKNINIYNYVDSSFYVKALKEHVELSDQSVVFLVGNDNIQIKKIKKELELYFKSVDFRIFEGINYWEDFSFIANAKIAIIPNSTFSYCARLLNNKITYCTNNWYLSKSYKRPNNNSITFI